MRHNGQCCPSCLLTMSLFKKIHQPTGAEWLKQPVFRVALVVVSLMLGFVVMKGGLLLGLVLIALPAGVFFLAAFFNQPALNLWGSLTIGFFATGIARYINAPWGLLLDILLAVGWLACLFKFKKQDWKPLRNDIMAVSLVWYILVFLELFNPEMRSAMAWFYAMRATGLSQLMAFGLTFLLLRHPKHLDKFLFITIVFSIMGVAWGLRQMIFGTDAAEDHWLYVDGYGLTHILHGVLRVFSFYSDAGQFGAQQAMMALICGIIAIGPYPMKTRIWYGLAALITFVGFGISGTRGALAVPGAGAVAYLIVSRNFRLLAAGVLAIGLTFYFLKYTYALQGVEQVRRMRTALDPNDESLLVRLRNQAIFGHYLKSRPFGGGIGSAGFWGNRFSPGTLLANTPTDSYYVKVWAETGLIGISLHMFMFGFFIGKGGYVVWNLRDPQLRQKIMALYAGFCGVLLANYGNAVYSQFPTAIILYMAIPFIFMSPEWDKMICAEKESQ